MEPWNSFLLTSFWRLTIQLALWDHSKGYWPGIFPVVELNTWVRKDLSSTFDAFSLLRVRGQRFQQISRDITFSGKLWKYPQITSTIHLVISYSVRAFGSIYQVQLMSPADQRWLGIEEWHKNSCWKIEVNGNPEENNLQPKSYHVIVVFWDRLSQAHNITGGVICTLCIEPIHLHLFHQSTYNNLKSV